MQTEIHRTITVEAITSLQKATIKIWHSELIETQIESPWTLIENNNKFNFLLWHEEDIARIENIEPEKMIFTKRNIDKYNQLRNNAIEKIDEWILAYLVSSNDSKLAMHSETPGMMIDRLSIMALKRYHMFEETMREEAPILHKQKCEAKVSVLDEQIADLSDCLDILLFRLKEGLLYFKVYRQLKMYNEKDLNPQLYKK